MTLRPFRVAPRPGAVPRSCGAAESRLRGTLRAPLGVTWRRAGPLSVQVVPEDLGAAGVAELGHGLGLDLADPLAGDAVDLPDLVKGARLAVGEAEAQPDDAGLPLGEGLQHAGQLVLHEGEADRVDGDDRLGVLDEVAELAVALVTDGLVEADGLPGVLLDLQHLVRGDVHLLGQLLRGGLAPEVLEQLALDAAELVDDLDHVHRDADGAGLVGHGAGDRLPDPPGRVRGELVALGVVELLDRADQAEVALLDEVQERHAAAGVALGQGHHEAQVGLEQVVLGALAVADDPVEVAPHLRRDLLALLLDLAQPLRAVETGLDPLGEVDLLLGVEQRDLADLLEVGADGVGGGGELGVLAGLPKSLGLLLVVPLEVAALGGLLVGDGLGGATVGTRDDGLVELETFGAGIDHRDGRGVIGHGGQHGALTDAGRGHDGGLARGGGLRRRLLAGGRLGAGLHGGRHRLRRLGYRGADPGGPGTGGYRPGALRGARCGCFRCWLVGGHSGSFPCWVRSPGAFWSSGSGSGPRTGSAREDPADRRGVRPLDGQGIPPGWRATGWGALIVTACWMFSTVSDQLPRPDEAESVPRVGSHAP